MTMSITTPVPTIGISPPRFRLPAQAGVGRVRLVVSDISRSVDYYTQVLGFIATREQDIVVLSSADGTGLIELREQRGVRPVPRRGRIGLYHFAILLPDRGSLGRFVGHLGRLGVYVGSADHLVSEALYLTDPDGLGIEVYADRPRTEWRTNGREIAMATEPLDLPALLRSGGDEPWSEMPPGTTIGHVHFHVPTLSEAENFFHHALGFDKVVWSYPGALFFSAGGYHHHVGTNTWAGAAPLATDGDARLLEWELRVPTADAVASVAASVAGAGYPVTVDGKDSVISDPSGIKVRVTTEGSKR